MLVTLDPLLVTVAFMVITFPSFIHCTSDTGGEALYRQINVKFSPLAINCSWLPSIATSGSSEIQIKLLGQSDVFQSCCSFEWTNACNGDYGGMKSKIQMSLHYSIHRVSRNQKAGKETTEASGVFEFWSEKFN